MTAPGEAEYLRLLEQFRQALVDCRNLYDSSAREHAESKAAASPREAHDFMALMQDLERGLLVKVFVEVAQSDWRWSQYEHALAAELIEHLWGARLEPDQVRRSLKQLVEESGNLNWGSLVRPFTQVPVLRERIGELQTVVMRLANLIAKIDGQFAPQEADRLRWIQQELERHLESIPLDKAGDARVLDVQGPQVLEKIGAEVAARPDLLLKQKQAATIDHTSREDVLAKALTELDGLIGLASIKHEVRELINFLKVQVERSRLGLPKTDVSLHMLYCGNPGTGKTTVARLIGRIFQGMGILNKGHLVETDRSGLVAEYAGQSGPKTHKKVDDALDGLLFIDEAYSLVAERGDDPYGNEALQALLKRIEDDRQRLVVILAGYPEPMDQLLDANPGLASRFNRRLDFPDYTASELGRIFQAMCEKNHYVLPASTRYKLLLGFQHLLLERDEKFGNGRLARNVFESAIRRLANRIAGIAPLTVELLTMLEPDDIRMAGISDEVAESLFADLNSSSNLLTVECPGCGHAARFAPKALGRKVKCKRCQETFWLDWGEVLGRMKDEG